MSGPNSGVVESFSATPGTSYTVSADAMTPASDPLTGNETGQMELLFYNSSGTLLSSYAAAQFAQRADQFERDGRPVGRQRRQPGMEPIQYDAPWRRPAPPRPKSVVLTNYYSGTGGGEVFWDDVEFGPSVRAPPAVGRQHLQQRHHHGGPEQHGHDQRDFHADLDRNLGHSTRRSAVVRRISASST